MRVLVAGGTGVLGRAAVPRLVAAGHDVVAVSRREATDESLRDAGAQPARLDLLDPAGLARAAADVDAVVNLATHIPSPPAALLRRSWRTNDLLRTEAAGNLADVAIASGARFVQESFAPTHADGGEEWIDEDHPLGAVAQTRTVPVAEAHAARVRTTGADAVVLRFGLFYGSTSADTRALLRAASRGVLMLPGPADAFTSMVHVDDAAAAVVAALTVPSGTYDVVEDEPLRRGEHARVLGELLGRRPLRLLPAAMGHVPILRVVRRSHRISNARLRGASPWRCAAPSVRQGWRRVLDELEAGA